MFAFIQKLKKLKRYKLLDLMVNLAIIGHCHIELVKLGMIKITKKLWFQLMMLSSMMRYKDIWFIQIFKNLLQIQLLMELEEF